MKLANLFKKNRRKAEVTEITDPNELPEPTDVDSYIRRGWAFHSRHQERDAEADFRRALELDPESVDANYVLGLVLKAQNRQEDAVASFRRTIELLEAGKLEDRDRTQMLRRLSLGHINEMTQGDWNLEEEVWHRKGGLTAKE
jgi:tetratricopeptide (TPR) repeat protein